jgi:glycosyltransferase involved in cell wall biosynthesis
MSAPRITIVIPTYNRAHFLREAIRSALAQTYQNFELVIADDGSTDNTPEVVSSFTDPRLRYYRHAINRGLNLNWQFAFSKATTEFIAPLADDDLYLPEHLATALAALEQYPAVAYYTCAAEYFGREMDSPYYRPEAIADRTTSLLYWPPGQAVMFLGSDNPGPINCMVCRREALHEVYWGQPNFLPQDLLIMTQLMARGGFVFGNRALTRFRVHTSNTSLQRQRRAILKFNCMVWYAVRWLAEFLLHQQLCTLADIEAHGLNSPSLERHVVPLVLGLGSFDSPPELRAVARRVFEARPEVDAVSARLRLARRLGFWVVPNAEKITQLRCGWHP